MYALITHHDSGYQPLADITWHQNKAEYCKRHGYDMIARTENFVTGDSKLLLTGFEKIYIALEVFKNYPKYEWVWWTGTDTMITNMSTRLEDRCNNAYHFIICVDVNGINADSILMRNSPQGIDFLTAILANQQEYLKFWDTEQRAIANLLGFPGTGEPGWPYGKDLEIKTQYKDIVKIMPQRYMNSFNYQLYPQYRVPRDKLDFDGNWQMGDWLIHWPAVSLENRIELAKVYNQYIIR